jgi:F-type H+-transporting ATPase subunit a
MEHPFLYITWVMEQLGIGVHFAHSYPWVTGAWVVMLVLALAALMGATAVRLIPGKAQNVLEVVVTSLEDFFVDVTGEHGRFLFPLLGAYFLFIFTSNMIGLLPGFFSPTANMNTTLALALVTFVVTHAVGLKTHGVKYIKHFLGSIWWLSPLFFVIEIISHLARVLSLTFRLFGNIVAEDLVLAILILLAGWYLAPLPMLVLFLFADFVQAFIFTLLSAMYFAGALEHAH